MLFLMVLACSQSIPFDEGFKKQSKQSADSAIEAHFTLEESFVTPSSVSVPPALEKDPFPTLDSGMDTMSWEEPDTFWDPDSFLGNSREFHLGFQGDTSGEMSIFLGVSENQEWICTFKMASETFPSPEPCPLCSDGFNLTPPSLSLSIGNCEDWLDLIDRNFPTELGFLEAGSYLKGWQKMSGSWIPLDSGFSESYFEVEGNFFQSWTIRPI